MAEPNLPDLKVLMLDDNERRFLDELIVTHAPAMSGPRKQLALSIWDRLSEDTVAP